MRRLLGPLILVLAASPAHAWTFPEHARISELAFDRNLDARTRRVLEEAVASVAGEKVDKDIRLPLCIELTVPFSALARQAKRCIPLSVLPALAGDHAVDVAELRAALWPASTSVSSELAKSSRNPNPRVVMRRDASLSEVSYAVSEIFARYLEDASPEEAELYGSAHATGDRGGDDNDDRRRMLIRELDLYLFIHDGKYMSRASGSRSHFQDTSAPISDVASNAAIAGELDNALAQLLAHHLRSLQLAVHARPVKPGFTGKKLSDDERIRLLGDALLEHAFALHFLEDAYAAGHIGTSHGVGRAVSRLRRHDYLNRVGLPVTRVMAQHGCHPATREADRLMGDHCWVAYGDGYLDADNANRVATAAAQLSLQLALAIDPKLGAKLIGKCREPKVKVLSELAKWTGTISRGDEEREASGTQPQMIQEQRGGIVHVRSVELTRGQMVRVSARSKAFDPFFSVLLPSGDYLPASYSSPVESNESLTFTVEESGTHRIGVLSKTADHFGDYEITVDAVEPARDIERCEALLHAAAQLDPRPPWTMPKDARAERRDWSDEDRAAVARRIVEGATKALESLSKGRIAKPARAAGDTAAQPGTIIFSNVEQAFRPCRTDARWIDRTHPFCEEEGTSFRFDSVDANIVRPLLAMWPGPTSTTKAIEGEDAFGTGLAAQVTYNLGYAVGVQEQVPMALGFTFGGGFAYRADRLLPGRVNRELIGLNVGITPLVLIGMNDARSVEENPRRSEPKRFVLGAIIELRIPVVTLIGAISTGRVWSAWNRVDFLTGIRLYSRLPAAIPDDPGDGMALVGWDIELLNIKMASGNASRTASMGSGTDTELRFRFGYFQPSELDATFDKQRRHVAMIVAEIATGYSFFLLTQDSDGH